MINTSYVGKIYDPIPLITSLHASPRFGHSKSIVDLFYKDTSIEYILGLLFVSALLFTIFIIWIFTIFLFKFCGEKRVGCLSGSGFHESQSNPMNFRIKWARYVFMLCGVLLVTSCTLFSMKGVNMVNAALLNIQGSSDDISNIANQAYSVITKLYSVGNNALPLRDSTVKVLDSNLCPNKNNLMSTLDAIGSNITISGVVDTSPDDLLNHLQIINQVEKGALKIVEYLEILNDFTFGLPKNFESTYSSFIDKKKKIDYLMDRIQSNSKWLIYLVLPVGFLAFIFAFGTSLVFQNKSPKCFQRLQSLIFFPLFMLIIILFITIGLMIYPSAVVNSDFCLGVDKIPHPDQDVILDQDNSISTETFAARLNNKKPSIIFASNIAPEIRQPSPEISIMSLLRASKIENPYQSIIQYYIEGCRTEDPFAHIRSYEQNLLDTRNRLTNFTNLLTSQTLLPRLEVACQRNYTSVLTTLFDFSDVIDILISFTESALDLVSCRHLNEIYISFVHDTVCRNVPIGTTWMFATFTTISFCGMIMMTLRSSWSNIEEWEVKRVPIINRDRIG